METEVLLLDLLRLQISRQLSAKELAKRAKTKPVPSESKST